MNTFIFKISSAIFFSVLLLFVVVPDVDASIDLRKGDLISASGEPEVYLLNEAASGDLFKRWIPSFEVFNAHVHLRWGNIQEVAPEVVDEFRAGVSVDAEEDMFPFGALSSTINNPEDYLPDGAGEYRRLPRSTPVYSSIDNARAGIRSTTFGGEATWANVLRVEQEFSLISMRRSRGWVPTSALGTRAPLSGLRGVNLEAYRGEQLAMVYVNILNVRSVPGTMDAETRIGQVHQYNLVTVQEERVVGGVPWYRIDDDAWIHSAYVRNITPGQRPAGVGPNEKWIEVNIEEQTIIAHEGDVPVYAALVSTGRFQHDTITGLFRPESSHETIGVSGANFGLPYVLADTPWWVFFSGNYGWHGTYWHDNFGTVQSAGCVNLSPFDSDWFFQWADHPDQGGPGTWVYVHEGI